MKHERIEKINFCGREIEMRIVPNRAYDIDKAFRAGILVGAIISGLGSFAMIFFLKGLGAL